MQRVIACDLPPSSLLSMQQASGAFVDGYSTALQAEVTVGEFVEAFYTTRLFKVERLLIRLFAFKPSSDREAMALATGQRDDFAIWQVERRVHDQLLLADRSGRTRSWLMVAPQRNASAGVVTRLYFGSALLPRTDRRTGEKRFGLPFRLLLRFHVAYSKALLRAAASKLLRRRQQP